MATLHVTTREGEEHTVEAENGFSVMEALQAASVGDILALCGGACSCATCHVIVAPEWIEKTGPAGEIEGELLDASDHKQETSRLSCQIKISPLLDGLKISVAPED